jgi:hypothetical protein
MSQTFHIPVMTDPLGRHWQQPDRERILLDETHALMTAADFRTLLDYTHSEPTGQYVGKMWKRDSCEGWILCYLDSHEDADKMMYRERLILLVD